MQLMVKLKAKNKQSKKARAKIQLRKKQYIFVRSLGLPWKEKYKKNRQVSSLRPNMSNIFISYQSQISHNISIASIHSHNAFLTHSRTRLSLTTTCKKMRHVAPSLDVPPMLHRLVLVCTYPQRDPIVIVIDNTTIYRYVDLDIWTMRATHS